jgi:calcineurin-like phosphoesterase
MTGPLHSVLGVSPEIVIRKNRTHMPCRFTVADGEIRAHGVLFDVDASAGRCKSVKRIVF